MNVAIVALAFILTLLTLLGVPLTGFLAGFGVALTLALMQGSALFAIVAMAAGLVSEGIARGYARRGRGSIAQALSLVVFGRALGPALGLGLWLLAAEPGGLPVALRQTAVARGVRLVTILAALALLAIGMRG